MKPSIIEADPAESVSEVEALRARLALAEERIRFLEAGLEAVPIGVVLADADGRIFHGNSRVEELVRHPVLLSPDVDSYTEWVSFHEDGRRVEGREYPLAQVIVDGADRAEIDVHYQRGDGTRFWMRIVGRPVFSAAGERIGASVALIDIDAERTLQNTQKVMIGELNHRVKNAFAVVGAVVSQSLRHAGVDADVRAEIEARLNAFSVAHSTLMSNSWNEAMFCSTVRDILDRMAPGRCRAEGPDFALPARQALNFSMAFYELATNAIKYGALSVPEGSIDLDWSVDRSGETPTLRVDWRERNGPPVVPSSRKGFGSFIVERAIAMDTRGKASLDMNPDGAHWHLEMPLAEPDAA